MKFEEYLKIVLSKLSPTAAFDMARDAQLKAFQNILIEKGIATKDELDAEVEKVFGESAMLIHKMPSIPQPEKSDGAK